MWNWSMFIITVALFSDKTTFVLVWRFHRVQLVTADLCCPPQCAPMPDHSCPSHTKYQTALNSPLDTDYSICFQFLPFTCIKTRNKKTIGCNVTSSWRWTLVLLCQCPLPPNTLCLLVSTFSLAFLLTQFLPLPPIPHIPYILLHVLSRWKVKALFHPSWNTQKEEFVRLKKHPHHYHHLPRY